MTDTPAVGPDTAGEPAEIGMRHVPNAVSAVVLFTVRLLAAVLQLRIVDQRWGGDYTGLNALGSQVLLFVTLLELGLSQSAITLLYEPLLKHNHPRVSAMISALRHDVRLLAGAGAVVLFPAVALYARFIRGGLSYGLVAGTLGCIAVSGFVQLMAIHFQAYLNSAEQMDKVNYTFAAGYLLKTGIGLPLALYWNDYLLLPATIAVLTAGEYWLLRIAFHRGFPQFQSGDWRDAAREIRGRARFVLIQRVAGLAYYQSDFVILSVTTSLLMVRNYAKFQYVSAALLAVVGLVAASLTTSLARQQLRGRVASGRKQYVTAQFAISIAGAVLMVAFWFTARTIVEIAFGPDFAVSSTAVILFGIALFLNIVKAVDDVFIVVKGAFHIAWWIPVVEVPVYVISGAVLSRRMGIPGILAATIGTNVLISILVKGLVLPVPVFDSTRSQWYGSRAVNMAKAMATAVPLVVFYALSPRVLHPGWLRFGVTNLVALAYMFAAIRWLALRRPLEAAPASER
jgi:O-antigen/teichoic acid export membrane protein